MAPPLEAVTFDFWNTIAQMPPGLMTEARQRAVAAACADCGVAVDQEHLEAALGEATTGYERSWSTGTHFHPRDGAALLTGALGAEGAAAEAIAAAFLTAGRGANLDLAPEIEPCLQALGQRGIRLGIVCDVGFTGGALLRELLAEKGLLAYFSGWAFSDEVGHYKPAPQIFEVALTALEARPQAALHVGDLRRTDVAGAAALGMSTARYRALHDDPQPGVEADVVIDSHRELLDLVERLG